MNKIIIILTLVLSLCGLSVHAQGVSDPNLDKQVEELTKEVLAEGPRFSLAGVLEQDGSRYAVNGTSFSTNSDTKIFGDLQVGSVTEVRGLIVNGKKIATHLVVNKKPLNLAQQTQAASGNEDVGPSRADGLKELKSIQAPDGLIEAN